MLRRGAERDRPSPEQPGIGGYCAHCGSAFAVGARRCPDCRAEVVFTTGSTSPDLGLLAAPMEVVDDLYDRGPALVASSDRHDIVSYDLSEWSPAQRRELSEQLQLDHIVYEWSGTELRAPGAHEADVDALIDVLDEAEPGWTPTPVGFDDASD